MKNGLGLGCGMSAQVIRNPEKKPRFIIHSIWDVEHKRRVQKGSLYEWIDVTPPSRDGNICTDQGINALIDIMFHGTTQITTWYVEIFESNTTCVVGMTYASPAYTPSTAYDEATRPAYVEAAASSKVMTNSANKAVFTISSTKTIYGASLLGGGSSATTKADVAGGGTLFSACLFSSSKPVVDNDVINVTITITGADA